MNSQTRGRTVGRLYLWRLFIAVVFWVCLAAPEAFPEQVGQAPSPKGAEDLILKDSAICESLKDNSPVNAGVVFPTAIGRVVCLTSFNPASRKTAVFHIWFHRGLLNNKQRVAIAPPGSAGLSSIQLREADKGPWHVEISDSSGRILKVLRFSIVD